MKVGIKNPLGYKAINISKFSDFGYLLLKQEEGIKKRHLYLYEIKVDGNMKDEDFEIIYSSGNKTLGTDFLECYF